MNSVKIIVHRKHQHLEITNTYLLDLFRVVSTRFLLWERRISRWQLKMQYVLLSQYTNPENSWHPMSLWFPKLNARTSWGRLPYFSGGTRRSLVILAQPPAGFKSNLHGERHTAGCIEISTPCLWSWTCSITRTCGELYGFNVSYVCNIGVVWDGTYCTCWRRMDLWWLGVGVWVCWFGLLASSITRVFLDHNE